MTAAETPEESTSRALDEARRHRVGVRRASADLERALAAPVAAGGSWATNVSGKVRELRDAFSQHVAATEHPDGVLAESVSVNPRLAHRADMLRRDHQEIAELLADLEGRLGGFGSGDEGDEVRAGALEVLARISQHRHLGADLVYQAYMVDIEAAD